MNVDEGNSAVATLPFSTTAFGASGGSDTNASGGSDTNASGGSVTSDTNASGGSVTSDTNASGGSDTNASGGSVTKAELRNAAGTAKVLCSVTATGGGGLSPSDRAELHHQRHAHLREQCAERGITISRRGECWLLEGAGVRLLVSTLRMVHDSDLRPVRQYARQNEV